MNPLMLLLAWSLACSAFGLACALTASPVLFVLMLACGLSALRVLGHFRDDY